MRCLGDSQSGGGISARPDWDTFGGEMLGLYQFPLRSPRTLAMMARTLRRLALWSGVDSPADLDPPAIARFVSEMVAAGLSRATIAGMLGYARAICSYAVAVGCLARSPFSFRRQWVRVDPTPPRTRHLSVQEVGRLLDCLEARAGDWVGLRLYALTSLIAHTGLRRDEALTARVTDVDLSERLFFVRASSSRLWKTAASAQPVPLPPRACEALGRWMAVVASEWLFPGVRRLGPWTGGACGERACDRLRAAAQELGIEGVTWLALRHSFATHAESAWGWPEGVIRRVLRHTTMRTSLHYYRHADVPNLVGHAERVDYTGRASTHGSV